ncbi:MAG: hypothetical protein JNM78_01500 [Cyclobacteriaceae bacterium]|nr:hypothetical protein [Cyclobacteriaceae bacterium]
MVRIKSLIFISLFLPILVSAQKSLPTKSFDLGVGGASNQGTLSAAYIYDWSLGKKEKIIVGIGGRVTSYIGANQYYSTAPAKLTSGSTGPAVFFKENIIANIDTFLIAKPRVVAMNAMINLGYKVTQKISVGFNIDAIGFSVGYKTRGNYINGSQGQNVEAKPTVFNLLLVSDNDLGSLNSEFYGKYKLNETISLKAAFQFIFTEYTTEIPVQQFPEPNDRFRNKSSMFSAAVSFQLN